MHATDTAQPFTPQLGNPWIDDAQTTLSADWLDRQLQVLHREMLDAVGSGDRAVAAVRRFNGIVSHVRTHADAANLAFRRNSSDADLAAINTELRGRLVPRLDQARQWLSDLCEDDIARDGISTTFGEHFIAKTALKARTAGAASGTALTDSEQLVGRYAALQAAGRFTYGSKQVSYAHARKAASDPDREVRHQAFGSYVASLEADADQLVDIYTDLLSVRRRIAEDAHLDSFVDYRYAQMGRTDWGPDEAGQFRSGVREHLLPLATDIRGRQAASHGADSVHPADVDWFPDNRVAEVRVPAAEFVSATGRMFDLMGEPFASFFSNVIADDRIDAFPRDGKAPGAYVATLHDGCEPFIYMNCLGLQRDVKTITHESGHAFQTTQVAPIELIDLRKPTLEACEIHSMTLELFALPATREFFAPEDVDRYRQDLIEQAVLHICYCCAVDEFQHAVHAPDFAANAQALAAVWRPIADTYMPGVDHSAAPWWHDFRWLTQRHVFMFAFYYLDYAIAQAVAFDLWRASQTDHDAAMQKYLQICRTGGTASLTSIVTDAELAHPFAPGSLRETARFLTDVIKSGQRVD